jgi:peptidyl-prolyl cis-trans isomerase B (cyclophilin B)
MQNPIVSFEFELGFEVKAELFPEIAPNTVNNFISLINDGFYDGTVFHRCLPGFVLQGGDPTGTGMGNPGYCIKGEFSSNGFENNLSHTRGVLSMARANTPDSAGSQFFIVQEDSESLDGDYAAFGKIIDGMEFIDAVIAIPIDDQKRPILPTVLSKVKVETFEVDYPEPDVVTIAEGSLSKRQLD